MRRFAFVCLALIGLQACSSALKRAQTLFEGGAYDEALTSYDEILRDDPKNADALVGQLASRNKVLDTKLIQVRLAREASNQQQSTDMLLDLIQKERTWNFYPSGKVAFTQEEESSDSFKFVSGLIKGALKNGYPLQAEVFATKYKPIFTGKELAPFDQLVAETQKRGVAACVAFVTAGITELPYHALFVKRYCAHWGAQERAPASENEKRLGELYSKLEFSTSVQGLPDALVPALTEKLQEMLTASVWYDPKGSHVSRVKVTGLFVPKHDKELVNQVHEYTIQVPYTAYVPVMKTRQVPYQTTQYQCVYNYNVGNICGNVPVTAYRTEFYSENEPVTLYQTVPKTLPYQAYKHYQTLILTLDGKAEIHGAQIPFNLAEKSDATGMEHDWNRPEIGLYPKKPNLPDPLEWVKGNLSSFASDFATNTDNLWEKLYCKPSPKGRSTASSSEQIHRCLRLKHSSPPEFIANWYKRTLGVSLEEAKTLIGIDGY